MVLYLQYIDEIGISPIEFWGICVINLLLSDKRHFVARNFQSIQDWLWTTGNTVTPKLSWCPVHSLSLITNSITWQHVSRGQQQQERTTLCQALRARNMTPLRKLWEEATNKLSMRTSLEECQPRLMALWGLPEKAQDQCSLSRVLIKLITSCNFMIEKSCENEIHFNTSNMSKLQLLAYWPSQIFTILIIIIQNFYNLLQLSLVLNTERLVT